MSKHLRARPAAVERLRTPSRRAIQALIGLTIAGFAAGCWATPPAPLAGPDPSDPSARTPAVGYSSTIEPYARQRPVEPLPWREQNERVTPPAKR